MKKLDDFLDEQLRDSGFKKEYEALQPETEIIRTLIEARISQNLTQQQ